MNEKIKKTFRAITSAALAGAFVVSSAIGGGVGGFVSPAVVSAEENIEAELTAGVYSIPLIRQVSENDSTKLMTSPLHYYARAILSIDENGSQTVTIGVENWSLYECFIPKKQTDTVDGTRYLPSIIFDESNTNNFTNFSFDSYKEIIDNNNDNYNLGDQDTKFGDITVDADSAKELDVAYVTFKVDDYKKSFTFTSWLNTPFYDAEAQIERYESSISFHLNEADILNVDEIYNGTAEENFSHSLTLSSNRSAIITSSNVPDRSYVNYDGTVLTKGVFDSSIVTKQEDNTYLAKYHVNPKGFQNKPNRPVKYYCDFKILNTVSHPISNGGYNNFDEWDVYLTGSYTDLDIDEEGYISVTYNSFQEAVMGKYIFFDCGSTTDATIFYCMPCISLSPVETFSIIDEESGAYVVTDTSVCSKTTKLKVEKNKEISLQESNTGDTVAASDKWNCGLYKDANWYTFNLTDENDNILNDRFVDLYVPCSKDSYADIWRNGDHLMNSEQLVRSCEIKDGYLVYKHISINDLTIAIMGINDKSDIYSITDDGIYTAEAFFLHTMRDATPSMADSGLIKKVYIVVEHGTKKMYFKSKAVSTAINGAYIGDIHCNNIKVSGEIYEDSISYTNFKLDGNELAGNMEFNPYTEYADIEGGILTLMDESYLPNHKVYDLAVSAPIMTRLANPDASYGDIKKDELQVWLALTNLEKCNDSVTMQNIIDEGYGYQPSALLRKIRQAELKLERKNSYSSKSVTKLQSVYDAITKSYGNRYDSLSAANLSSNDIENMITDLDNAIKALDGITVAGYNAQLDKDVTFDFYLSMNKNNLEAAQDGDLTANITKADGSTETVEVGEDGKIEFNVAPKEIGQTLKVKIGSYEFTYSVQEYLEKLIWYAENPTECVEVSEKDAAIAKSLLVYGGYAQDYFVKKAAEANAYVDTERAYANVDNTLPETADNATTFTVPQLGDNIKYYGAAVVFDYTTDIRLYFTVDDAIENHSFAVNDKAVDAVAVDGGYYIAIENIYANQLGNPFKITVDGTDFQYGVYNYIAAALNATEVKSGALNELQALVKALYQYAELTKTTA